MEGEGKDADMPGQPSPPLPVEPSRESQLFLSQEEIQQVALNQGMLLAVDLPKDRWERPRRQQQGPSGHFQGLFLAVEEGCLELPGDCGLLFAHREGREPVQLQMLFGLIYYPQYQMIAPLILLFLLLGSTGSSPTEQQLYLEQLLHRVRSIEQLLTDIGSVRSNLNVNLQLGTTPQTETRLRVGGLEDESELSLQLWSDLFLPISLKTWSCPAVVNKTAYSSILKSINQIQFQSYQTRKTLESEPYCYRNQRMQYQNQFIHRTMLGLKKEIVQHCDGKTSGEETVPFLVTEQTRNIPNLNTKAAWTYGNITARQYQDKSAELQSVYGAVPCPVNLPFLGKNNLCFRCNQDGQVYDVAEKECKSCSAGCSIDGGRFNSDTSVENHVGDAAREMEALFCPKDEPFFNGQHCISCNLPFYFNFPSNSCQSCPLDTGFDPKTKQCISNAFFLSFPGLLENYIGSPFSPPAFSTIKKCTIELPYSNGTLCTACTLPNFYNYHTGQCESCPSGLVFSVVSRSCGGGLGTKTNTNLLGDRNFIGPMPVFDRLYTVCPVQTRFFNGVSCISCKLPQYFNFQSMKCESCFGTHHFDVVVGACVSNAQTYFTNSNSQKIYFNGKFQLFLQECEGKRAKGLKQCPLTTPFYDPKSNNCIDCQGSSALFDAKRTRCMECPSGSAFNPQAKICISNQVPLSVERMIMNAF